jgi:EmrB/QacA subfamily drug resistance transporter
MLVAARAAQAAGAAMLAANSPAILTNAFPEQQRGRALGFQATAVYLGLAIGPPLGGWLAALFGWSAVFLVSVPLGLCALVLAFCVIPHDTRVPSRGERFDLQGTALFTAGLVLVIVGLNQAHAWGWASPVLIACLVLGGAAFAGFVAVERLAASPLLDLELLETRAFTASVVSATLNYASLFAMIFVLPFYMIDARGLSVAVAGIVLTVQPLVMALTAPVSGIVSDRIGARLPATAGMAIIAIGLGLLSRLAIDTPLATITAILLLIGVGVGLFSSPNTSAALGAVPRPRRGVASGVLATARNVGMLMGIGIGGAILTSMLSSAGVAAGPEAMVEATNVGLLCAAAIALVGALTSAAAR